MRYIKLLASSLIVCTIVVSCGEHCKTKIIIYEGLYFEKGQSYRIEIDGQLIKSKSFARDEIRGQNFNVIENYCCNGDSCQVKFTLEKKDTLFYISPTKTKRLLVGSDINGDFSIATDQNRDAWVRM